MKKRPKMILRPTLKRVAVMARMVERNNKFPEKPLKRIQDYLTAITTPKVEVKFEAES